MPRIFGNLAPDSSLLPALQETLGLSSRADFYVGCFSLRGWGDLAPVLRVDMRNGESNDLPYPQPDRRGVPNLFHVSARSCLGRAPIQFCWHQRMNETVLTGPMGYVGHHTGSAMVGSETLSGLQAERKSQ